MQQSINMDREYRLSFCTRCLNREFNAQQGIICSLTKERASFDDSCKDFNVDDRENTNLELRKEIERKEQLHSDTYGLSKLGIKSGILAGVIIQGVALAWFIYGFFYANIIFFYPPILFIIGFVVLFRGIRNRNQHKSEMRIS